MTDPVPVCRGQVWTYYDGSMRVVLADAFAVGDVLWVPVGASDDATPECKRVDVITAGELVAFPTGEALGMARRWRRGALLVEPIALRDAANLDAAADGLPEQGRKLRAQAVFLHAMTEAGSFLSIATGLPFDPCPVCGWKSSTPPE